MNRKILLRIIYIGFVARLIVSLVRAFGDILQPHVWRQVDTLGMSYRYWLRFLHEPKNWKLLLPAVLQSGDGNGILPAEFPFLNFIFSPFWFFGPYWGKALIYVGLALLIFGLCYKISKTKVWFAPAFLLLPFISYSADYIEKFIPDTLAMLLVSYGSIRYIQSRRWMGCALVGLGLLIKPTSVVALAILFLVSRFRKAPFKRSVWLLIPIAIAALYYTAGLKWIDRFREGDVLIFFVSPRNPLQSLSEIFSNSAFIYDQFQNRMLMAYGGMLMVLGLCLLRLKSKLKVATFWFGLLLLQFSVIAALDGGHSAQHDYYYMGLAPIVAAMIWLVLRKTPKVFAVLIAVILVGHSFELSAQNLNRTKLAGFRKMTNECDEIKRNTPEIPWGKNYVFRSKEEPFPSLGLCFGEREGSKKSKYGFFYSSDILPSDCKSIAIEGRYQAVQCDDVNSL